MVKIATHVQSGDKFALKIVDKKKFTLFHTTRPDAIMSEVQILQQLDHPNIIKMHDVLDAPKTLYMVLELVSGS